MFKTVDLSMVCRVQPAASERGRNIPEPILSATVIFVLLEPCRAQIVFASMPKSGAKRKQNPQSDVEICILAGGASKRMGRDKSRLRLGTATMLDHIRKTARATGLPVRVIRRDCVPKCGPVGGIYTALKTTRADAVLFLACDMPLVRTELIQFVLRAAVGTSGTLFVCASGPPGFPLVLQQETIELVRQQIEKGEYSLQSLAKALGATILSIKRAWSQQLFNVNTPGEWEALRRESRRFGGR